MADDAPVVLSLQERCLLYLITHVEDYSLQTLALLPRHLRRALLSSVPPLHLYQLDQTEVASGIDTEALWGGIWNLKRDKLYEKISEPCSQELFVICVEPSLGLHLL